jgi:hypothetical protein
MGSQPFEFLPTPYDLAVMLNESGAWPHDLGTRPPELVDDEDLFDNV